MQPQGPYGPPQQPYPPQGPPAGPQGSFPPGQPPYPGGQPYPPQPPAPGQQFHPGQPPMPGAPQAPGHPFQATPGQPPLPSQPPQPGQPPIPQYQVPQHLHTPNQQPDNLPPPPDAPTTPYDFFMQPKPMPSSNPLPVTGKKLVNPTTAPRDAGSKNKFILMAGGALAVIIILFVAIAMAPKDQTGIQLFGVAQAQQEVIRVCNDATKKSKQRSTRNFAITCATGVATNQKELIAYLDKQGYSYNAKAIGDKANGQTDARLKSASSSSTYDDTFRDIMEKQLNTYNSEITQQLGLTTGANAREVLTKSQRSAEMLLQMVRDDSDKTEVAPEPAS